MVSSDTASESLETLVSLKFHPLAVEPSKRKYCSGIRFTPGELWSFRNLSFLLVYTFQFLLGDLCVWLSSALCTLSSSFSGPKLSQHFLSTIPSFIIYLGKWRLHPPSSKPRTPDFSASPFASMDPLPQWPDIYSAIKSIHLLNSPCLSSVPGIPLYHSLISGTRHFSQGLQQWLHIVLSWLQSCPSNFFSIRLPRGFF